MTDADIKARLFADDAKEELAERIFRSMRFDRESETPKWRAGNSHAEMEARGCAASVIEIVRERLRHD